MRAQMVCVGPSAGMTDNKPEFAVVGFFGAFPGFSEQPCLVVYRERAGFSDVDFRRAEFERYRDHSIGHVLGRHDKQPDRTSVTLCECDNLREKVPLGTS